MRLLARRRKGQNKAREFWKQIMVRNEDKLKKFYQKLIEQENISHKKALFIYEAMHKEAVSLGIINSKNILEGLEIDLRIARAINGLVS
jgi:predicted RNase H-related nuclease YkuK (DUF458 family)